MANREWFRAYLLIFIIFAISPITLENIFLHKMQSSLAKDPLLLDFPYNGQMNWWNLSEDSFFDDFFKSTENDEDIYNSVGTILAKSPYGKWYEIINESDDEELFFKKLFYAAKTSDYQFFNSKSSNSPPKLPDDFYDIEQLIKMNGYQCETHDVLTDDGYIVIAHRIVTGINGPPVILQHGFLEASDNFLLLKENSLAFLLAEAGYDVWMTNFRGNYYSRGHVKYDRSMTSYWNFSFHECGYYDIPAFIDKIILVTGYPQVFYIGHSMGTTAFIVMASSRPEYNAKIRAALLMAQVVITPSLNELSFPMKMVIKYATTFCKELATLGFIEFLPRTYTNIQITRTFCGLPQTQIICLYELAFILGGENKDNLDLKTFGNTLSYLPAGHSIKTADHLAQIFRIGLRYFDYGAEWNLRRYNSEQPPKYPLAHVTAPVAIYSSANDMFSNERGAKELASQLKNVILNYKVPDPKFTHLDYIFGKNSKQVLYSNVLSLIKSLTQPIINYYPPINKYKQENLAVMSPSYPLNRASMFPSMPFINDLHNSSYK